jgi:hypothetical protein
MKYIIAVLTSLLILTGCSKEQEPLDPSYTIWVKEYSNNQPIDRAEVRAINYGGFSLSCLCLLASGYSTAGFTDAEGRVIYNGVKRQFEIRKEGFYSATNTSGLYYEQERLLVYPVFRKASLSLNILTSGTHEDTYLTVRPVLINGTTVKIAMTDAAIVASG